MRLFLWLCLYVCCSFSTKTGHHLAVKCFANCNMQTAVFTVATLVSLASTQNSFAANELPQIYGLKKGSLLACKTQSNCVSTSSVNSVEKYARPWASGIQDSEKAWVTLVSAVSSSTDLKVVELDSDKHYIRAEGKSAIPPLGVDDVEFLLNTGDNIVTYRSNSRELVYAGVQMIGDAGSNKNRLETVRRRLGWSEMGVDTEVSAYLKEMDKVNFFQRLQMASQPSEVNFLDDSVPDVDAQPSL